MARLKTIELPFDVSDLELTQKELIFVGEYCTNGFNDFEALKASGIIPQKATPAQARINGLSLSSKPNIKKAIQRFTESVLAPYKDKLEYQTLQLLQARAFYDVSTFFDTNGKAKPLDEIPQQARYALDDITEDFKGKDADVRTVKYKLADRMQARKELEILLKKGEDEGDANKLPTDRKEWLNSLFAKAGAAGALAVMVSRPEPIDVTPPKKESIVLPPKIQKALSRLSKE